MDLSGLLERSDASRGCRECFGVFDWTASCYLVLFSSQSLSLVGINPSKVSIQHLSHLNFKKWDSELKAAKALDGEALDLSVIELAQNSHYLLQASVLGDDQVNDLVKLVEVRSW